MGRMGEFELLARVRERLPPSGGRLRLGSGDDAAVTVPEGATATSVDAVVEGVHFDRERASLGQIGHKALAAALSDLAAMGAEPGEAYVVLGAPPDLSEDECIELLDGMVDLARSTGTDVAGGDVTRARELFLALTVVGHAPSPDDFVSRAGARPGELLVLTGEVGGAAAGLIDGAPADLRARQLEPRPRLDAGRALARVGATAMIDVSDGLGADAGHRAERSGVHLGIDAAAVPVAAGVHEIAERAGRDPWRLALGGGEDYELLATVPPERLDEAMDAVRDSEDVELTRIGEALAGEGVEIRLPDGRALKPEGFDQLS
jgi:thiamine-monophosphate kinase